MIKSKKLNPAATVILSCIGVILVGTFLLCLPISSRDGQWFSFVDSLLTATSAVCITGLATVDIAVHFTLFGQIVILLLVQIGGLGFITITCLLFLLIGKKITYAERRTIQESFNQDNVQGMVKLVIKIVILVFVTEFIGILMLLPSMVIKFGWGKGIFSAIFLSISAFCNAGVDNFGSVDNPIIGLSGFAQDVWVLLPVMLLIIVGGIGFIVLLDIGGLFKHKKLSYHTKVALVMYAILIVSGTLLYGIFEWNNPNTIGNMSVGGKILNSLFLSVTPRTAGFSTFDYANLTPASTVLTIIYMFIGGGSTSTAGGIKVTTFACLLVALFKKENENGDVVFAKRSISRNTLSKCNKVVGMALIFIIISSFSISAVYGIDFTHSLFESMSAISNVGLSVGVTTSVGVFGKLILSSLMFVGKIGPITLMVAMNNIKTDRTQDIQFPDSKIIVG